MTPARPFILVALACLALGVVVNLMMTSWIGMDAKSMACAVRTGTIALPENRSWLLKMPEDTPAPAWFCAGHNPEIEFEFQSTIKPGTDIPDQDGFWWWLFDDLDRGSQDACAWGLCIVRSGWPMRCQISAYRWMEIDCVGEYPEAVRRPVEIFPPGPQGDFDRQRPTRTLWLGFSVNSVLYAIAFVPVWMFAQWVIRQARSPSASSAPLR